MKRNTLLIIALVMLGLAFLSLNQGVAASTAGSNKFDSLLLSLPAANWALEVCRPGFEIGKSGIRQNLQGVYFFATNQKENIGISVYIERAEKEGDVEVCRDTYWSKVKGDPGYKNVKLTKYGDKAITEYTFGGRPNLHAYLVKDGFWIDLHLSKSDGAVKDGSEFYSIVDAVRIIEKFPKTGALLSDYQAMIPAAAGNFISLRTLVQNRNSQGRNSFAISSAKSQLALDLAGFKIIEENNNPQGDYKMIYARDYGNNISMTIDLMTPLSQGGSTGYRDMLLKQIKKDGFKRSEIKTYELADRAFLEFMIYEHEGEKVDQKNILEFIAVDDLWVCVHVSTMSFKEEDYTKLKKVLDSAQITAKTGQESYAYWQLGNEYFHIKNDYKKAIEAYEKARELEAKNPQLDSYAWIILIDNLGMAYGMTGKLDQAFEVLNTGISRYPEYPLFYFSLACFYAEKNDLENALLQLEKAYLRRGYTLLGEKSGDPLTDDSFKPFWNNEKLRSAAYLTSPSL